MADTGWERVGRDTGPGRFEAELVGGSEILHQVLLFNYNIDGNVLKPEHKADLDQHLVPLLRGKPVHARLLGMASQSGDREYNRQLSIGRVVRVKKYLLICGIGEEQLPGPDVRGLGEDFSTSPFAEDERDRAVRIQIKLGLKWLPAWDVIIGPILYFPDDPPPPPPPPTLTVPPPGPERWSIMQIHGVSTNVGGSFGPVSYGAGTMEFKFLLVNHRTKKMSQCTLFGVAGGGGVGFTSQKPGHWGLGPSGGISWTMSSNQWDTFTTPPGTTFADFEGEATWKDPASLGLGTAVSAQAHLKFVKLKTDVPVSTGKTLGTPGGTAGVGSFSCRPPVQLK